MTDLAGYSADQALNRDLLLNAVNGASLHWARVHGYTADCAPDEVRAEGIDLGTRAVWSVDLDDIDRAVTILIDQPLTYAHPRPHQRPADCSPWSAAPWPSPANAVSAPSPRSPASPTESPTTTRPPSSHSSSTSSSRSPRSAR